MDVRLHLLIWSTLAFLCVCGSEEGKHAAPRIIERQVGEHAVAIFLQASSSHGFKSPSFVATRRSDLLFYF